VIRGIAATPEKILLLIGDVPGPLLQ
jgi:hypothetical protein